MSSLEEYKKYYKDNPKGYWFKRKLYGWGWTPVTKEGWGITLGYAALLIFFAFTIDESSPPKEVMFTFFLPIALLTAALIRIAYSKGEPPKWMWGLPKEDEEQETE